MLPVIAIVREPYLRSNERYLAIKADNSAIEPHIPALISKSGESKLD